MKEGCDPPDTHTSMSSGARVLGHATAYLVEIVPIFLSVFAHVYHYAISELFKGLYRHNGV